MEGGASPALQPPGPPLCGIWHESADCCFYLAVPAPEQGDMIHTVSKERSKTLA